MLNEKYIKLIKQLENIKTININSKQAIKNIITNLSYNAIEIRNLLIKIENVQQLKLVKIKILGKL